MKNKSNIVENVGLTKIYNHVPSVNHIDMKVPVGCIYGFLGPNGAGKSTTMKMILNLVKPTEGYVNVFGTILTDENRLDILKKTGSLIESPSYYGHLSGRENLKIVQMLKKVPESEIEDVLHTVRMENQQHKKVSQYSLGMKQRLGLAMALLGKPKLLLLDEPTNGLDPAGIQEMRELICSLPSRYQMTVLISSHLLSEIDQMANYVGIIDKGNLIFQDTMEALQEHSQKQLLIHTLDDKKTFSFLQEHFRKNTKIKIRPCEEGILIPLPSDDKTAALTAALAQNGNHILRVEERHKTLENIFLELTGRRGSL